MSGEEINVPFTFTIVHTVVLSLIYYNTHVYLLQQAHWPAHMSTCAQNQANQEEESPGADPAAPSATSGPPLGAPEGVDPSTPGGHFLSGQAALAAAAAAGQPPQRSLPATSLHQAAAAAAAARTLQVRQNCLVL